MVVVNRIGSGPSVLIEVPAGTLTAASVRFVKRTLPVAGDTGTFTVPVEVIVLRPSTRIVVQRAGKLPDKFTEVMLSLAFTGKLIS